VTVTRQQQKFQNISLKRNFSTPTVRKESIISNLVLLKKAFSITSPLRLLVLILIHPQHILNLRQKQTNNIKNAR